MEEEQQVEVPCYFLCPISLHIMRDPVTLPTGITYDRDGIERWLLAAGTCPLTKQPVAADCEPTPNHTLRRLIQSWCALHAAAGVERVPTPKPPADRARVTALVSRLAAGSSPPPQDQRLAALRELRDVAAESERNRKLVAAVPGAVDALAAAFVASATTSENAAAAGDEALEVIASLQLPEQCMARVVDGNEALVDALVSALQRPNAATRTRAARLLVDAAAAMPANRLVSLPEQLFRELVQLLRDRVSKAATKAALHALAGTAAWGRNRVKAVDAGAVAVLVDMLVEAAAERRACELALAALARLCGCAEGRAELVAHGAGVAVVGRRALMRVSEAATDRAVRVLRAVAKHAATAAVVQEMAQAGAVGALCVVAQASPEQCGERTRERARETLRLHARAWRSSPCLHPHLRAMYPPC
ncbi:hypothetical protein ACP4OV_025988 [Aristida adscensionis]